MLAIPRPFIAAGVAVVGTGAIAISPVAVPPPDVRAEAAIQLTASTDWADIFTRAGESATALFDLWREAPAPILQQIIANQLAYLKELPDFAGIASQIQRNFQHALAAPPAVDLTTLDTTHRTFYELLPVIEQLPGIPDLLHLIISPTGKQLLAFSTTALSGVLLGLAGPVVGPLLVLESSLESIRGDLGTTTPDVASAMETLAGIPAAMTDAFLNGGQHVDITALVKAVGPIIGVGFPDGVKVGIGLGGLLTPGGSAFNALDFAYDNNLFGVLYIHVPLATGTPVGPIGSLMELTRTIAKAIGWDGGTNPAAAPSSAAQSLTKANELPRSVLASTTANAAKNRFTLVDKTSSDVARFQPSKPTAKRTSTASSSGKASSARATPAKAAAG
jgi:hypothetical protein